MDELFPVQEVQQDSPKLAWMKKHGLETEHFPGVEPDDESPETGDPIFPWVCRVIKGDYADGVRNFDNHHWSNKEIGGGNTEAEAILDFCENSGIPHWTVENKP